MRSLLADAVREAAQLVGGTRGDYDGLLELVGDARFVLLGDATNGSHELYRERARITQRLIAELGFNAVVLDADWPAAARVDRWLQAPEGMSDAGAALAGFEPFPSWRWRNPVVLDFLGWLRRHNQSGAPRASIYGLDRYSLCASLAEILRFLDGSDAHAAQRARRHYSCLDHRHPQQLAFGLGLSRRCIDELVARLVELHGRDAGAAAEYYRAMFSARASWWGLRKAQLAETLLAIASQLRLCEGQARVAVWAHSSLLGDARATGGEASVGQLLRERAGSEALLVGLTTCEGTLTAALEWDSKPERLALHPAPAGSLEELFHQVALPRFVLPLRNPGEALGGLHEAIPQRAVGVVYRPHSEWQSHCFLARVAQQFDALVHVDRSRGVEPLEEQLPQPAEAPHSDLPERSQQSPLVDWPSTI
jgi:erythromycin esterase-like protein